MAKSRKRKKKKDFNEEGKASKMLNGRAQSRKLRRGMVPKAYILNLPLKRQFKVVRVFKQKKVEP